MDVRHGVEHDMRVPMLPCRTGGVAVVKKLAAVAICLASLSGNAMAQDAKTVIANAQKALGDPKSITYSGSAKDVAFQQCGANSTDDDLPGDARSDAADQQLRPRHRPDGARVASDRRDEQHRARRLDDADARNVLPAGHAAAGGRLAAVEQLAGVLHHALGFPERRGREQRDRAAAARPTARTTPSSPGAPWSRRRPASSTSSTAT